MANISGGTLELEYGNTVTTTTNGTPSWALNRARVYIPSPAGNVGSAELAPAMRERLLLHSL